MVFVCNRVKRMLGLMHRAGVGSRGLFSRASWACEHTVMFRSGLYMLANPQYVALV